MLNEPARGAGDRLETDRILLRTLEEASPDFIWVCDAAGHLEYVNQRWRDYTGITVDHLNAHGWACVLHPDDVPGFQERWTRALREGNPFQAEFRYRRHDGEYRWFWRRVVPLKDEHGRVQKWAGMSADITERKRLEDALTRQNAQLEWERRRLQTVLDILPVSVFISDADGRLEDINPAARRIWGGASPHSVSPNAYAKDYRAWWTDSGEPVKTDEWGLSRALGRGEPCLAEEMDIECHDGTRKTILNYALPIKDGDGGIVGAVAVNVDISDRKRMEADLREHARQLAEADQAKNEFLAMLSHEIRNPMNAINNAVHLMQTRAADDPVLMRSLGVTQRQTQQLTRLIDDLLDVSRITRGEIQLRRETVSLASVVLNAVETVRPDSDAKNHTLTVTLASEPIRVEGDGARLEQIVTNLLGNAVKYTEPGGYIQVVLAREEDRALLYVMDNGMGIPPDALPRVFDMFLQGNHTRTRSMGGLGIGLTVVKRLVELHGGEVTIQSDGVGKGVEVSVRLPVAPGDGEPAPEPETMETVQRQLKVLVVDDVADAAEVLAEILSMWGHSAEVAHDGETALGKVRSARPDVVLLDLGLPRMDGMEVARAIRQAPELAHTRLVALTGYGSDEEKDSTRAAGFDAHLVKPANLEDLRRLLGEWSR